MKKATKSLHPSTINKISSIPSSSTSSTLPAELVSERVKSHKELLKDYEA